MDGVMESFRGLIKLEAQKDHLAETNPNTFEEISLLSFPESWETQGKEETPKSIADMEPFCLNWTDFDMKFQGKWDLIVEENKEPLPEEEMNTEGFRDLYGPPPNLDDYPHLPSLYCSRAQPTRLPRNPKKIPFPVICEEDLGTLQIKPWMIEAFPPSINWSKQLYKGYSGDYLKPLYVRWNEYPEFDMDEANALDMTNPFPTVKDLAIDYIDLMKKGKKPSGMTQLKREKEPRNAEQMEDYMEQKSKDDKFKEMMIGELPKEWFNKTKVQDQVERANHEIIGGKFRTLPRKNITVNEFMAGNPLMQSQLPWEGPLGGGRRWRGKKGWGKKPYNPNYKPKEWLGTDKGPYRGPREPFKGTPEMYNRGSWTGKVAGATGWNRGKLPRVPETKEEFFDPPHPEEPKQ